MASLSFTANRNKERHNKACKISLSPDSYLLPLFTVTQSEWTEIAASKTGGPCLRLSLNL